MSARDELEAMAASYMGAPEDEIREAIDDLVAETLHEAAERIRSEFGTPYDVWDQYRHGAVVAADLIDPGVTT